MARPLRLDRRTVDTVVWLVGAGAHPVVAARACGFPDRRFYEAMARGRQRDRGDKRARARGATTTALTADREAAPDIFIELVERVEQAEAVNEARIVASLAIAAELDPAAAIALLERRFPARWGRR